MPRCLRNILFWGAKVPLGSILGKEQENGVLSVSITHRSLFHYILSHFPLFRYQGLILLTGTPSSVFAGSDLLLRNLVIRFIPYYHPGTRSSCLFSSFLSILPLLTMRLCQYFQYFRKLCIHILPFTLFFVVSFPRPISSVIRKTNQHLPS